MTSYNSLGAKLVVEAHNEWAERVAVRIARDRDNR